MIRWRGNLQTKVDNQSEIFEILFWKGYGEFQRKFHFWFGSFVSRHKWLITSPKLRRKREKQQRLRPRNVKKSTFLLFILRQKGNFASGIPPELTLTPYWKVDPFFFSFFSTSSPFRFSISKNHIFHSPPE